MLYDGARRFLRQASIAMREGEIERAHNTLRRAELIIAHLDGDRSTSSRASSPSACTRSTSSAWRTSTARACTGPGQAGRGQRAAGRAARGLGPGRGGGRPRVSGRRGRLRCAPMKRSTSTPSSNWSWPDAERSIGSPGDLGARWEELTRDLPARPPAAALPLLQRARLIHERTRIELFRVREGLLSRDLDRHTRARRAADGYAGQPTRRLRLDRSA